MKLIITTSLLLSLCLAGCAATQSRQIYQSSERAAFNPGAVTANDHFRGWDFLVAKLREAGVAESQLEEIYAGNRIPAFENIPFKLHPSESLADYSGFFRQKKIEEARTFLMSYRKTFDSAQREFKVDKDVVAALLLIETQFGRFVGEDLVIYRLSRLASISDPANVEWNFQKLFKDDPRVTFKEVQSRAQYLEDTFLPEIQALFKLTRKNNVDIFQVKGSKAGAFGLPQFLPSSYLKYALDGNADGVVSLYREEDAIYSVANFLHEAGWDETSNKAKRKALWQYNKSEAYVNAVLKVAALISGKQLHAAETTKKALPAKIRRAK